ncbi:MAG: peptide/nickel transport system substrate-binding protein [Actinomycetota bacterium]|nr:peptide/nickel transport system substrate-binding protein [Actinomycetota bacterium]
MDQGAAPGGITRRSFLWRSAAGTAIVAGGLPAILAACTKAADSGANPSGGPASTTSTLRVGWSSEPDTMNPLTSYSTEAQEVLQLVYDKLNEYVANLQIVPALAESTEVSGDGKTIIYHLRTATWHDGEPFTADDVVFTFTLINDEGLSQYAQWLVDMVSVTATDATTVEVAFKAPQAFDPSLAIPIIPKHIWNGKSAGEIQKFANDTPIGTGPFTFGEWQRGQTITVKRNDKFWGPAPGPASVIWVLYQNEDVMAQGLQGGDVDILPEIPPTIWDGLANANNVKPVSLPGFSFHHIGINVSTDPKSGGNKLLLNRSVRQALSLAVDRDQLVQIALAGHGQPGSVLLPPAFGDFQLQVPADQALNANQTKANDLLDTAGFTNKDSDGFRSGTGGALDFRLIAIEATTVDVRAAQLFRDAAAAVGIKLNLQTMDENTLGSTVYNSDAPDWDIFVWGWDSGVNDPDYLLGVPLTSQIGGNNDVYYADKTYDGLYDQQAAQLDRPTRVDLVHQMQQQFYDDCAYIVMWYQDKLQGYRTDTWTGWTETAGGIVFNFTRANYLNVKSA